MPEVLQARRRNSWLGVGSAAGRGEMESWIRVTALSALLGALVFRLFMEEQEEAVAARGWERAVADVGLLKNCLLGEKTGQGDRSGDGDQIEAEVAKRNRNWFGEQGQKRQKNPQRLQDGVRGRR